MQLNNKFLSSIFNAFDMPVRFVYSHFSPIRKMLYKKLYSSDYKSLDEKFNYFDTLFKQHNVNINDKIVMEVGPGNSLILAYNFLFKGAKKVILVDKYPLNSYKNSDFDIKKDKLQLNYFIREREFLKLKIGTENAEMLFSNIEKQNLIEFIASDLDEIKFENEVDIIVSNSVFEHIYNPKNSIIASAGILKNNGIALHSVDLRDHYNFKRPFLFYKYSEKVWEKYLTKLGVSYTNRLRANHLKDIFLDAGFQILYKNEINLPLNEKKINSHFKGRSDLDISQIDLLLKIQK
jgi:SAM-dependent methyltransferase